ncbi:hypothetical protein SAMN05444161_2211 [Rhizobiales bacterium GAS191]|nr:hypothetical protein SAMN05519103_01324 [Rhizobiales bacterium GAS113]SEC96550.1 hypothetical protein SAMN05444161_2211 [Rhizobiales bacterium GAS191]
MVTSLRSLLRAFGVALAAASAGIALQPSAALAQFFGSAPVYGRSPSLPPPAYPGALDESGPRPPGLIPSPGRGLATPAPRARRVPQAKRVLPAVPKAKPVPVVPSVVKSAPLEPPAETSSDSAVAKPAGAAPVAKPLLPAPPGPAQPASDVAVAKPASEAPAAIPALPAPPSPAQPAAAVAKPGSTPSAIVNAPPAAADSSAKDARADADAADPNHPVPVVRQIQLYPAGPGTPAPPSTSTPQ